MLIEISEKLSLMELYGKLKKG